MVVTVVVTDRQVEQIDTLDACANFTRDIFECVNRQEGGMIRRCKGVIRPFLNVGTQLVVACLVEKVGEEGAAC